MGQARPPQPHLNPNGSTAPTGVLNIATLGMGTTKVVGGSDRATRAVRGVAPRFVLSESATSRIGARLAGLGWQAIASGDGLSAIDPAALLEAEVLVVACSERELLHPSSDADTNRVRKGMPRVAIVAGCGPEAAAYAARLGWQGFVAAERPTSAIARAIAAAACGRLSFPSSATDALVRALARVAPVTFSAVALTPRQSQIVTLLAQGATDTEIASLLQISRSTAHKHVQNARRRLGAKTRSQLVAATNRDRMAVALEGSL